MESRDRGTYDEAAINTNRQTETGEHKANLAGFIIQNARPETDHLPETVHNGQSQGNQKHIEVGEFGLGQMGGDHPTHGVRVHHAHKQRKGHRILLEDRGLHVQVGGHQSPHHDDRQETV